MKRLPLVLLILALLLTLAAPFQSPAAQRTVIGLGTAELKQPGGADSQDLAVTRALRSAIFQALETIVGPKRLTGSLSALAPSLLEQPAGYFDGYTVSSRVETDKRLFVVVSAKINDDALKRALPSLGLGRTGVKVKLLPMMLLQSGLTEPFAWWHAPGLTPPPSLAMDALLTRLTDLGVSILPRQAEEVLDAALEPEPEEAAKIGQAKGAELVLLGWLVEVQTDNGPAVRASCWVVDSASGAVVAGPIDLAVPDAQAQSGNLSLANQAPAASPTTAEGASLAENRPAEEVPAATADSSTTAATQAMDSAVPTQAAEAAPPQAAAEEKVLTQAGADGLPLPPGAALEQALPVRPDWTVLNDPEAWPQPVPAAEAGKRLADLLAKGIQSAGWVLPVKPRKITLEVSGVTRYLDLKTFLAGLDRFPDLIQNVRQQAIRAGKATFIVKLLTTPENLGEQLSGMEFPTFFATVEETTEELIRISLIPK